MARFRRGGGLVVVVGMMTGLATPAPAEGPAAPDRRLPPFARYRSPADSDAKLQATRLRGPVSSRTRPTQDQRGFSFPSEEAEFNGLTTEGSIAPSDTVGAAGPGHVMTAVNISYAIYDKGATGTTAPLLGGTLQSLFPTLPASSFVFDPKVVYDHYRNRFILIFLAGRGGPFGPGKKRSEILIATIPGSSPTDPSTWCKRRLNADQIGRNGPQLGDYPGLGFDRERVYVTTNMFSFTGPERFEYAQILAIGKTKLYGCQKKLDMDVFGEKQTRDPRSSRHAFTIQPAVTQSEVGRNPPGFLVSFQERTCGTDCGRRLTIWRVKDRRGRTVLESDAVNVGKALFAPLGTQRDGSPVCVPIEHCWDTGDLRLTTAFFDADRGRLYAAHTVRTDITPGDGYLEAAVRWYEVDPSPIKRTRATRRGIIGASRLDAGWPAVATDAAGNLFVTFSRAGAPVPGEYLSSVAATIPPGATSPDAVQVLAPGESLYAADFGRFQRWGDYNGINRDPLDPLDIWMVNQYARSDGTPPTTNLWQQVVHRVSFT
jgi:hypothetical protein